LDDIFIVLDNGDYQRLIFNNQELREKETTHLEEFRGYMKSNSLVLPAGYDDANMVLLRFLQGLKWDHKKTYDDIVRHSSFLNEIRDYDLSPIWPVLKTGIMYGYKRDVSMRPIIVINVRRILDSKVTVRDLL